MSQPQIVNPDAAYRYLQEQVYLPTLRDKIAADYPQFAPKTVEDLLKLAQIAEKLRPAYDAQEKKASEKSSNLLDRALSRLDASPIGQQQKAAQHEQAIKQASVNASFHPQLAQSVLSMILVEKRPDLLAAA